MGGKQQKGESCHKGGAKAVSHLVRLPFAAGVTVRRIRENIPI
jgi:hypothetical protein